MFGILKPAYRELHGRDRVAYSSIYCNLCGALAAEYGLPSRLLVVHDIATLAWLLTTGETREMPFNRGNCLRGGAGRVRQGGLPPLLKYLAAISAFTLGVKLQDDERDQRNWRNAIVNATYQRTFNRSSQKLQQVGADTNRLRSALEEQCVLEARSESELECAAAPTAQAYAAVVHEIHRLGAPRADFSFEQREALGAALGATIYAIDAFRDYEKDLEGSYNPLCVQAAKAASMPQTVRGDALRFIENCLASASGVIRTLDNATHLRWNAIAAHLLGYLRPLPEFITLSTRCYVPCEHGVVAFDDKECTPAVYGCLCCCCLGLNYCCT
ncbi:hypothetical protein PLANPX_3068 [Lacipirellula parvula]|uniref:Uncharacterized protein n=2 Tax=Lacipirellula parvula TaxID=2650471 RepID=A0A5K7XGP2_9BACT|nr:hypothetical protein PLANPX_3068 [Lacipirellula parvula]